MPSQVFDFAYRKMLRAEFRHGGRWRKHPVPLREDKAAQQFNQIVLQAKEYFNQKANDLVSLPSTSAEKLLSGAANGLLSQYQVGPEDSPDQIRDSALLLADKMDALFQDKDPGDEQKIFATKFAQSMREFHNQVEPSELGDTEKEEEGPPVADGSDSGEKNAFNFQRDMGSELPAPPPAPARTV